MKKYILTALFVAMVFSTIVAQEKQTLKRERHLFSPEQFQAEQRNFITKKAELTVEEADAFFPMFFELQKEKFRIEHEARNKVVKEHGQKLTDEEIKELLAYNADAKIEIAKLEKSYIEKYTSVVSPKKLLDIQRAEHSFQSYMIKRMARNDSHKEPRKNYKAIGTE